MDEYDLIIICAGVAGLSGTMYGARLGLKTLCLGASYGSEMPVGGVITTTNIVENYPGFIQLSGPELAEAIEKHARSYELANISEEKVISVKKIKNGFKVKTNKKEFIGKTILFATGTKWKKLEVPGGKEFENKGVAYCALCDAPLFKNRVVAVIGGSDSAGKDALVLAEHAKKVYIIYRGEKIRAEPINMKRILENKKIEIINETNIMEIKGNELLENVFFDKPYEGTKKFKLDGLFIEIGRIPLSGLAKNL